MKKKPNSYEGLEKGLKRNITETMKASKLSYGGVNSRFLKQKN